MTYKFPISDILVLILKDILSALISIITDEETNHNRTVTIITYLGECGKCVQNFIKEDSAKTI